MAALSQSMIMAYLLQICADAGVEVIGKVTFLPPGRLNEVCHFLTNKGQVVVRARNLVDADYHQQPAAERTCYPLLEGKHISKPALIASDTSCEGVPFAWAMFEYIDGTRLDECQPDCRFWRRLGSDIAQIHSISAHGFGKITAVQFPADAGAQWLLSVYEREYFTLRTLMPSVAEDFLRYGQYWAKNLRGDELRPRLVHGDLHARNICVRHGEPCFIDWEAARYRPALSDLAKAIVFDLTNECNCSYIEAFYRELRPLPKWTCIEEGYREIWPLPRDWRQRALPLVAYAAARQIGFEARYPTNDPFYPTIAELRLCLEGCLNSVSV